MRIFDRGKKETDGELALHQIEAGHSFDMFAALAKALLLFMLVYGSLGGFLSAYGLEYNKGFCMFLIFFFALFLCIVYEIQKKWIINTINLFILLFYFYIAFSNYWVINSGYYAIINRMYEVARGYLGITGGMEYTLVVDEAYMAVTIFALFIGMVGCILLNIQLQNKVSLTKVVLLTFTPYLIPFYFELTPSFIHILFLFTGYVTVAALSWGNVRKDPAGQIRYVLPVITVFVVILLRVASFLAPQEIYELRMPLNPQKAATEKLVSNYAQFGLAALFQGNSSGAGVGGGTLSRGSAVIPDYETDLIVRYTPYSLQPVYLKAFTGKNYEDLRWSEAEDDLPGDGGMSGTMQARRDAYETVPERQGRGIMEIENTGASAGYEYLPYYTDPEATETRDGKQIYTYYPSGGPVNIPEERVDEAYLAVPPSCLAAVQKVCKQAGFAGTPEEIAAQIINYFQDNYSYTMRPGFYYGSRDYITHFLVESKRGYCEHFASAGTMLFRNMGIPARYVEGYAFSYYDVIEDGTLVEGAAYEDYYSGYAPMGETGLVELEIPDAFAHAWVEIYIAGRGWIVVDPTPSSAEEETTSFWEAFLTPEEEQAQLTMTENTIGEYLEGVIGGASYGVLGAAGLMAFLFGGSHILRLKKERSLSERERIRLLYSRVRGRLAKRDPEFAACRTLGEQLEILRGQYGTDLSEEQEQALYGAFFGPEEDCNYGQLEDALKKLQKCRKKHKKLI